MKRIFLSYSVQDGALIAYFNFETKGLYLITFYILVNIREAAPGDRAEFVFSGGDGTSQTVLLKDTGMWQHLNMIVEVDKPDWYYFYLTAKRKTLDYWMFESCEVTAWKK